jgi:hypothetical protein
LAAGALAVPLEPIPGVDVLYDVGIPLLLIWYWFTFFKDSFDIKSKASRPRPSHGPNTDPKQIITR